ASVIDAAGKPPGTPTAPLAARGAGFTLTSDNILQADPVTFVAGRDDVMLSGRVDDLAAAEAAALITTLNGHFAADGLTFHAPRPDAWFVTTRTAVPAVTTALSEVTGRIYPHLPRGDYAKAWRQWSSEMQMLLHEHPVNTAREAAGRAPVTGVWLAGGGTDAGSGAGATATIFATPGPLGDVARGLARGANALAAPPPADFTALPSATEVIVVLPAGTDAAAISALAAAWIEPAVLALERRTLSALALIADGSGGAFTWQARAPSWTQRLRTRFAAPAFAFPASDETA
ncbi:MAG: hypothetical protein ABI624_18820, partial [Casimicrobiaceae bacterium]